jgi:hypothetical protein
MAIDLKSLRKLESGPVSHLGFARNENERVVVVVKLREGAERPPYLPVRSQFSSRFFSSEVSITDLRRLEADPAVESVALSRPLRVTE